MDRMFEDFLGRRLRPFWPERWWPAAGMEQITTPVVDLYEEKDDEGKNLWACSRFSRLFAPRGRKLRLLNRAYHQPIWILLSSFHVS